MARHFYQLVDSQGKVVAEIVADAIEPILKAPGSAYQYYEIISSPDHQHALLSLPAGMEVKEII